MNPNPKAVRGVLLWGVLSLAALTALAGTSSATEVVDVRVGHHTTYTRFVVELDAPVRYDVSFDDDPAGGEVLLLRVPAAANAESKVWSRGLIRSVRVEPDAAGDSSVARVLLRSNHLKISETTLDNPPRLVFDVSEP